MADNPAFWTLHLMQPPSWVRAPLTYGPGSILSLVVAFKDPSGESLQLLLVGKTLFAFGHSGELRHWKQKLRGKVATSTLADPPLWLWPYPPCAPFLPLGGTYGLYLIWLPLVLLPPFWDLSYASMRGAFFGVWFGLSASLPWAL